jgi:hypothetical protein
MHLPLKYDLPCVTVRIGYQGVEIDIPDVVVDTGSGSTLIATEFAAQAGIVPLPQDKLRNVHGVGDCALEGFEIDVGSMDYGFAINGLLGMNFLLRSGAIIDLRARTIDFADQGNP